MTARLLELAIDRYGAPPVPYAWLAFGSAARSELTLASDQDNGLAYEDTDDPRASDEYFRELARGRQRRPRALRLAGRPARRARAQPRSGACRCRSGARSSRTASTARTSTAWRAPASPSTTARSPASSTWTGRSPTSSAQVPEHPGFLSGLVKLGTQIRAAARLPRKLEGSIDIKKNGLVPIQNLARYYAFASGITVASTLERLVAVRDVGGERRRVASACCARRSSACSTCSSATTPTASATARPVDNIIETWTLPPLTRASLQEALREVVSAQKRFKPVEPPR